MKKWKRIHENYKEMCDHLSVEVQLSCSFLWLIFLFSSLLTHGCWTRESKKNEKKFKKSVDGQENDHQPLSLLKGSSNVKNDAVSFSRRELMSGNK